MEFLLSSALWSEQGIKIKPSEDRPLSMEARQNIRVATLELTI